MLFDRLRSWNKYDGNQTMKKSIETAEFFKLRKQIELIGIDVKGLDEKAETGRLELKFINQHFINELDKIGLQLINIKGTWLGSLVILLEHRNFNLTSTNYPDISEEHKSLNNVKSFFYIVDHLSSPILRNL